MRSAPGSNNSSSSFGLTMQIEPAPAGFADTYAAGRAQVVWTTLVADLETPVSAFLKVASRRRLSFLLESVEGGATRGRYSVIGLDPDTIWRANGSTAEINRNARADEHTFTPCGAQRVERRRLAGRKRFGIAARVAVDLGAAIVGAPDNVRIEPDHRIAAAHRAALDRLE